MRTAYSCVVDGHPKFEWQGFLWAHSLLKNAGCRPEDLKVHCMPKVTEHFRETMKRMGLGVVETDPFEGGHAYCNKIQQCFSPAFSGYDRVALTDADLFFLAPLQLPPDAVFAAKVVDIPNPPISILQAIYGKAGVRFPVEVPVCFALSPQEKTFGTNLNGGFYLIDSGILADLGRTWKKHSLWLIERADMLGQYRVHLDQVAMALSLDEMGIDVTLLGAENNFPTNLISQRYTVQMPLRIDVIHYHSSVLPSGSLKPVGIPFVDEAVARANRDISGIISSNHDNFLFWSFRYACFPDVGSGVGSRGEILQYKKMLLGHVVPLFFERTVLEIGCGDLETSREFGFRDYTGYDLSDEALSIAGQKRPDWKFVQGSISASGQHPEADLVICLDVLIHQKRPEDYHGLVAGLVSATGQRLIVSGYQRPPTGEYASDITAFHEPLGRTLRNFGVFNEVMEIGRYRGVSMIVADKTPTGPEAHPNDLPLSVFNDMASYVDRPALLRSVMDSSRAYLGFYTQTSSRMIEYPWVLDRMRALREGALLLDIGSGISPLPPMLAERGFQVACVDSHPMVRTLADRDEWNEWGFFDYSVLSPGIRSFHTDILDFRPNMKFDAVYSVSVLEHMPRSVWERTLRMLPDLLKPGGMLLLTLDMVPGTLDLWNMCSGRIVDQETPHGGVKELSAMLQDMGFVLDEFFAKQNIPHSRTDVAFISGRFRP